LKTSLVLFVTPCLFWSSCRKAPPSIEFTEIPAAGPGGAARTESIAGRVAGAKAGQRVVLFARSGTWWVQPFSSKPFTQIQQDFTWKTKTHIGTEYAALLVEPGYTPPTVADVLPARGGLVLAVKTISGKPAPPETASKTIQFSGYEWGVYQVPRDSFGVLHVNLASNAWTDEKGRLHLRLRRDANEWTGAEIALSRSLGYGSYSFVLQEMPRLEPATALSMLTWDPLDAGQNHREVDIQLSQWGEPGSKNAQFAIQPYYVPANVYRFMSPSGSVTHSFRWEAGRMSFQTTQIVGGRPQVVAEHVFTSGVPSPAGESVHINLYVFGKSKSPQQNGVEVVIEKFAYLP